MNTIIGVGFIALGVQTLVYTYKNPNPQFSNIDLKGYLGGVCAIILGFFLIFNYKIVW
jgi:hypothetical protein